MAECICGAKEPCADECVKHGRTLHGYPCGECQREWRQANPRTAEAVARFASGKGSLAALNRAKAADAAEATS